MTNLPPGVTGREYQIAGPDWEGLIDVECNCVDEPVEVTVLNPEYAEVLKAVVKRIMDAGGPTAAYDVPEEDVRLKLHSAYSTLNGLLQTTQQWQTICQFSGEVEAERVGRATYWTCPFCKTEHEDEEDWT